MALSQGTLSQWGLVAVGIGALALAWSQIRANHNQMAMQLFDKRLEVFEAALNCMMSLARSNIVTQEQITDIMHVSIKANFLFGTDMALLLARLRQTAADQMETERYQADEWQEAIVSMIGELNTICSDYMQMDQKLK